MGKNQQGTVLVPLIIGVVIVLFVILSAVSLVSKKPQPQIPKQVATKPTTATGAAAKTNPFDTYKNPFEQYNNPFSQFKQ